ncbi:2-oxoglutarate dehydrogenase, E2 component, dihydrolipoamide succinyltransferase [Corynebacterium oculi]|uniref:Dihydrolipoamide acetyltransferase component of pyruvate dehydrogenase complex n=1 Tax=Corynebacterium oculi TaxID=1544416 RepID=A0A0Q1DY47_9CORY|nr:2-oxoglutarate dehydrogenase, E2 component, dihydrolipoamide succinyltransferase [Corynebacterium oculi]KQB85181.1 Dihydrolipoyllysine-residue acetyltransferase component of pyruvate dehydrogenase complex [Corynebacterium oculi]
MAFSVEMPELGESVTEGTITQWLKSVGDTVEADEPLLEVSTDKVDTEVPSPTSGVLLETKAEEDDTVDVGSVIAVIGDANEAPAEDSPAPAEPQEPEDAPAEAQEAPQSAAEEQAPDSSGSAGEATDVAMPELGESVTEGTITQWLKSVGDTVEADEPLLEVSTDKVDTEVPSPVAGTLLEILAEEDDTVDVGATIARIGDKNAAPAKKQPEEQAPEPTAPEAEAPAEEEAQQTPAPVAEKTEEPEEKKEEPAKPSATSGNLPYVTPLVRKLAEKHSVDLSTVTGTGVGGRIRKQDVLDAAEGASASGDTESAESTSTPKAPGAASTKSVDPEKAKLRGTVQKANRIRQITATKTVEALQTSAQLTQVQEVDMTKVAQLRKANKPTFAEKHGANLTYLPFFAKAVVEALVSHPNVNASYNAETKEITYHESVNLSIAVDTPAGLLTPVIHNAQEKTLPELAQAIAELADRARNNKLKPNDLVGGTFTITNIGSEGALTDTPILVPPQAGILGTGVITKRPVVVTRDGLDSIAIRQMVFLPLTYDHQLVDGADAGRFLTTVKDRLETADFEGDLLL